MLKFLLKIFICYLFLSILTLFLHVYQLRLIDLSSTNNMYTKNEKYNGSICHRSPHRIPYQNSLFRAGFNFSYEIYFFELYTGKLFRTFDRFVYPNNMFSDPS